MPDQSRVSIVIQTRDRTPAGKRNYLGETLRNLTRSGLCHAQTPFTLDIVDGGSPNPEQFYQEEVLPFSSGLWPIFHPGEPCTAQANAAASWQVAAEQAYGTDAAWVMVLEDDLDVCADFLDETVQWLAQHAREDRRLYPLGCPYAGVARAAAAGHSSWEYPVSAYWASQATVARPEDAASLARYVAGYQGTIPTCSQDWIIRDWAQQTYPQIAHVLSPAPGLVQHIGRESLLGVERLKLDPQAIQFFEFPSWRGRQTCSH